MMECVILPLPGNISKFLLNKIVIIQKMYLLGWR